MSLAPQRTSSDPADVAAFATVRAICRRHAPELSFASHFLPRARRDAICAVYAFSRMIDEAIAADDASVGTARGLRDFPVVAQHHVAPVSAAQSCCSVGGSLDGRMAMFRERLDEIYAGRLELPQVSGRSEPHHALHAFSAVVHRYEVPREHVVDLAEGRRLDLTVTRYATWGRLQRYSDLVGGAAGRIAGAVLGMTHSDAGTQAAQMGRAMHLTCILRDVKSDARRGRIYLPQEDLARFRYSERDLMGGVVNDQFRALMRFEIERVREMYRTAAAGICWLAGDGARFAASVAAISYAGILREIERAGFDVFSNPITMSNGERLRRLAQAWQLARRRNGQRMPNVFR